MLFRIIDAFVVWLKASVYKKILYDKKYVKSKWFIGRFGGIGAIANRWVVADWYGRKRNQVNRGVSFPVSPLNCVFMSEGGRIVFEIDDLNIFQGSGKYFQAQFGGEIYLGRGCHIANNVGLITSNHCIADIDKHERGRNIIIGEACWIGMNAVVLPGVQLGDHTVVGAGSVVTKSFQEGYCVIAGNPAKIIKKIEISTNNREES